VDDHAELLRVTTELVESWGHQVRCAVEGQEAFAIALAWHPDLVLLDIALPRMNGMEVARRIVAAFPEAERPVLVALTGLGSDVDRDLASAAGFDGFLQKPDYVDLLQRILETGGLPLPVEAALPRRKP
jgi:CheY-like chemotaxis protein